MVATVGATFLFFSHRWRKSRIKQPRLLLPIEEFRLIIRQIDPSLNLFVPDEAGLWPVDEVHSVGRVVLPSDFIGVVPQGSDLEHTYKQRVEKKVNKCDLGNKGEEVVAKTPAWFLVLPVCHRALRRNSPGPVVESTTLRETPAMPNALDGLFSQ